jgi:hypothetical protein
MFAGVALMLSEIPMDQLESIAGPGRRHDRGGEAEARFLLSAADRVLPVWLDGCLRIVRWGMRREQGSRLPATAWTQLTTLAEGGWQEVAPVEVVIPATFGLDNGVWYLVREGVRGIVVPDERGEPVVYVLVEPASRYYAVMTRSEWMPCLVRELI